MAQRPKEPMRRAIIDAAAREFADVGFDGAALTTIAARARTSIGNLYKYFSSKNELFSAAIPDQVVRDLGSLLRRRMQAVGRERDVRQLGPGHPYHLASDELLRFALAHRQQILFLLRRAEGTPYASTVGKIVQRLTSLAVDYGRRAYRRAAMNAPRRRALVRVYRALVASIASILAEETSERALREATGHLTIYHLAGLRAFFEEAERASGKDHP